MPIWIDTDEAARLSGYHLVHLRRLIRGGEIIATKKGGAWWVDRQALERFLSEITKSNDRRRGGRSRKKRVK
jgi:excisionase family DNA binding protein